MKKNLILLPALLVALGACHSANHGTEVEVHDGPWAGDLIVNASLNNAIVTQHTLYPYHFIHGSAALNELGERDLNVLVEHFLKSGGDLNVRRGDAGQPLYEERVKAVLERLSSKGVPSAAVAVKDGLPGGEGISSERVIAILKEKMSKGSGGQGSGSSVSSSSSVGSMLK